VPVEDEAVSAELEKSFRKQGITSHTAAKVTAAKATGDGVDIDVQLADGNAKKLRADYLLVATGRGPVTTDLNAEGVGLQMEKGYIKSTPGTRRACRASRRSAMSSRLARRASSTCPRLFSRGHPDGRAHRRAARAATQLRSGTGMHLLRTGDRQRRLTSRKRKGAASTCGSGHSRSACWRARRSRAKPMGS